jgi:peptide/nickel transport system substrate-binding protein
MRRNRAFIVALALSWFLAGCGNSKEPANPNALTLGSIGDAQRLIPMLASDSASSDISGLIFNGGLVKYDKHLNLVGDLAESFTASPDCQKVEFKLRKGVQWQDGKDFTSDDVLFTYQREQSIPMSPRLTAAILNGSKQ